MTFACPYLRRSVECSTEREQHILERHPEFGGRLRNLLARTLYDPDEVRRSNLIPPARLFSKWYADVHGVKYVVVVVVTGSGTERHWVITAYVARKLAGGTIEWKRT